MSKVKTLQALRLELAAKNSGDKLLDLTDQRDRVEELQCALSHAQNLMMAISRDRINAREAVSATYFASMALETLAHGMAEDAVLFAMLELNDAKETSNAN